MPEADEPELTVLGVRKDAFLGELLADSAPTSCAEFRQEGVLPDTGGDAQAELLNRLRRTPGLDALVAEAVATWRAREGTSEDRTPGWRAFSDAFPTFWEFSNRPR